MTLDKKQAADALYISLRTLERRMKAGVYKFTRTGEGQYAEVSFTYADLGLTEPSPAQPYNDAFKEFDEPTPEPAKPALKMREPSPLETKQAEELAFAERYKMGEVTDSYGNKIDRTNARCPETGVQCAVSPSAAQSVAPESQAHMDPNLIGSTGASANDNPLNSGMSAEALEAERLEWRRKRGGRPSVSEQLARQWRDVDAIERSFPHAQ
jgi:hypothetical protein